MLRWILSAAASFAMAATSWAHFVFIVPRPHAPTARVVFSETLEPDDDVDIAGIASLNLVSRDPAGVETPLKLAKAKDSFTLDLPPGAGTRVVHGSVTYGVQQRGQGKPHLLIYHPKSIVGDPFDASTKLPDAVPLQIVAAGRPGEVKLLVLARGKPLADAEVTVILPDGKQTKAKSNADGLTASIGHAGRFGAWTRFWEPVAGEREGKKFEETRHYATIVFDVHADAPAAIKLDVPRFATLPEATSSFGAVASAGWLYVYGGHIAPTHHYDVDAVSGRFHRLSLSDGKTWQELPAGPRLQGMNLAAHNGKVYRVGGMQPRNKVGDKAENFSITDAARFDPAVGKWEALPPLPQPRSSHDLVVIANQLIVVGGWDMRGHAGNVWLDTMLIMDLSAAKLEWAEHKQPFRRRALIAAVHNGSMFVVGGFDEDSDPIREVAVYDARARQWSTGPQIPGKRLNGFSPAACTHDGKLYISVGDGSMHRLADSANLWEQVATTTPRIVHRLVPHGAQILVIGGAARGSNFDLVEAVTVGK